MLSKNLRQMKRFILPCVILLCTHGILGCAGITSSLESSAPKSPIQNMETHEHENIEYTQSPWFDNNPVDDKGVAYPPVEKRLPQHPLVMDMPFLEIGRYTNLVGVDIFPEFINQETLMIKDVNNPVHYVGNVFESLESSNDFKTFIITLRTGMRWSDGTPITTEDIRFAIEDCWGEKDFYPIPDSTYWKPNINTYVFPSWCETSQPKAQNTNEQRGLPVLTILDDYQCRLQYSQPHNTLAADLTSSNEYLLIPSDFLKQFHPNYRTLDQIQQAVNQYYAEAERRPTEADFDALNQVITKPFKPTVGPWILTQDQSMMIRNPYYFKVDRKNRQLPYIDVLSIPRYDAANYNYVYPDPLHFKQSTSSSPREQMEEAIQYAAEHNQMLYDNFVSSVGIGGLRFVLNTNDTWWNELIRDQRFRKALCYSVNNEALTHAVADSYGDAFPGWEFDIEKARQLLNEVLPNFDIDGFRTWAGERIVLKIAHRPGVMLEDGSLWFDSSFAIAEVYKSSFEAVGIQCEMKGSLPSLQVWAHVTPDIYFPQTDTIDTTAGLDAYSVVDQAGYDWWKSGGSNGTEPLPETLALFQQIETYKTQPDIINVYQMQENILRLIYDNALCYPGIINVPSPIVADSRLMNISWEKEKPLPMPDSWRYIELWFMK